MPECKEIPSFYAGLNLSRILLSITLLVLFSVGCKQADYCNERREDKYRAEAEVNDLAYFDMCGNVYHFEPGKFVKFKIFNNSSLKADWGEEQYNEIINEMFDSFDVVKGEIRELKIGIDITLEHDGGIFNSNTEPDYIPIILQNYIENRNGFFHKSIVYIGEVLCVSGLYNFYWYVTDTRIEISTQKLIFNTILTRPSSEISAIMLHEIGHSLGIGGHSKIENDIMYPVTDNQTANFTDRDLRTLKFVYSKSIDIPIDL